VATGKPHANRTPPRHARNAGVPIVAIGASAGGLEALDAFLSRVAVPSGLAFVVIQHLDPTHIGMLPELLGRITALPVVEAGLGMPVEPDTVYVIPPNRDMAVSGGVLQLLAPAAPRGLRLPIDFFFRSLAEDRAALAVGVVLSGMGSDGSLGLRAIKDRGGLTFAQSPESAKFDAMPRNAITAGAVDVVAPVEDLPKLILERMRNLVVAAPQPAAAIAPGGAAARILLLTRQRTGADFSHYKRNTIIRRIERRMGIHDMASMDDYARFLARNDGEIDLLYRELLIGVTSFFRDPSMWDWLAQDVLPGLLAARRDARHIRAWVPGCSTGEEAFSLAITLKEAVERCEPRWGGSIQIFATDLDADAIDRARRATYPAGIAADVAPERLERYFEADESRYRLRKDIRSLVVFAPHNLISDPPFTKMDVVSCRNLLIYLDADLQRTVIPLLHYALNPGGVLLLGTAESIGDHRELFEPASQKERIFRRVGRTELRGVVDWPAQTFKVTPRSLDEPEGPEPVGGIRALADRVLLDRYAPAAVLTNEAGDIIYINGRTGSYLEPAAGKANWNIHAMARDGLRAPLAAAFRRAVTGRTSVALAGVEVVTDSGPLAIDVAVDPVRDGGPLAATVLVVFTPATPPQARRRKAVAKPQAADDALGDELRRTRGELEAMREAMQASLEELKSTNEELQSTNEELQSTNEELTTSKEELQSMNEELQVVNSELQARLEDLVLANSDMENLINSSEIATVFLDGSLRIRRFTASATGLISLIPTDVGRPLSDVTMELKYPDLMADAAKVLRTLVIIERQVATHGGRWYASRIVPYRTLENVIDGVVITFSEITRLKNLEGEVAAARAAAPHAAGKEPGT
jgi:two-component system CheB/CheR fusion protein